MLRSAAAAVAGAALAAAKCPFSGEKSGPCPGRPRTRAAAGDACTGYCAFTGCDWTQEYSCPWAPSAGTRGRASDDGSEGYSCCCAARSSSEQSCGGGPAYDALPAGRKQAALWARITNDTSSDAFMNPVKTLAAAGNPDYLWEMEDTRADWREAGHHKSTHGVGAHAQAHFEWERGTGYTGMFEQAQYCVIRMANAAQPGTLAMTAYGPNLAVKCLRDRGESANLLFIWQLDGYAVIPDGVKARKSCSYFEAPLANHAPRRDDIAMALKNTFLSDFDKVDAHSLFVGVSAMSSATQAGDPVAKQNFPFTLVLAPAAGLNAVPCTFGDYASQLLNVRSVGETLYDVYAVHDPPAGQPSSSDVRRIGALKLDSRFVTSRYGDTELFFRHTFFDAELAALRAADPARAGAWERYANDTANAKVEGANLYQPLLPAPPAPAS